MPERKSPFAKLLAILGGEPRTGNGTTGGRKPRMGETNLGAGAGHDSRLRHPKYLSPKKGKHEN